ncbi:MAG: HAMP domain-containing histidine kinase, partial [Lysobacteraceae bacterium]
MDRLAHDLRGALSPGHLAVSLLRNDRLDPSKRGGLLDLIDRQNQRLAAMIDEISDCVCAEQGHLIKRREEADLAALLDGIGPPAPHAAPTIRLGPGTEGLRLEGDTARLGQLLRTLVALRLARDDTQPARIDIELATPARVRLRRHIACTGGAVEQAEKLLDAPLPDPFDDGLGLGLLVARAIAEAHQGSLRMRAITADTIELVLELPLA